MLYSIFSSKSARRTLLISATLLGAACHRTPPVQHRLALEVMPYTQANTTRSGVVYVPNTSSVPTQRYRAGGQVQLSAPASRSTSTGVAAGTFVAQQPLMVSPVAQSAPVNSPAQAIIVAPTEAITGAVNTAGVINTTPGQDIHNLQISETFDYRTTRDVSLDIFVANPNGNAYALVPIEVYVPGGEAPIYTGLTDENGVFKRQVRVPTSVTHLDVHVMAIGLNNQLRLPIVEEQVQARMPQQPTPTAPIIVASPTPEGV